MLCYNITYLLLNLDPNAGQKGATNMLSELDTDIANHQSTRVRPTRSQAEEAVRTLLEWIGEDPDREGLVGTPDRMVRAYEEFFEGYGADPKAILSTTFEETDDYDEMVVLKNIRMESHCEHHVVPILGKVHIAYLPAGRVVGISKLARVVDVWLRLIRVA